MTFAASKNTGISRQRGFWLRCFLARACFAMAICLMASTTSWAKVEPQGPMHLWRIHGFFMNTAGKPIENVEISLLRDGAVMYKTRTDGAGSFAFNGVTGRYTLHIDKSSNYSQLSRDVIVGLETVTMLRHNTLYVIAGPAACTDDCSSVYTSKSDFDKAIRRSTGHHD